MLGNQKFFVFFTIFCSFYYLWKFFHHCSPYLLPFLSCACGKTGPCRPTKLIVVDSVKRIANKITWRSAPARCATRHRRQDASAYCLTRHHSCTWNKTESVGQLFSKNGWWQINNIQMELLDRYRSEIIEMFLNYFATMTDLHVELPTVSQCVY